MLRPKTAPRDHLLLPSHPTPNGPLHLGHIAGPYLKMDVLRRALKRRGDRATMIFSLDSFDSYVLLRADQLGLKPEEVVARYSAEIRADLEGLDIDVDLFLDPLSGAFETPYRQAVLASVESQRTAGAVFEQQEKFLYSDRSSRFIVGALLRGRCPKCNADSSGYSCEVCASPYRPEELRDPHSRVEEGPLTSVAACTLFMRVLKTERLREWSEEMLSPPYHAIVEKYLESSGASVRMSVPGTWGVPISVEADPTPQVVFSGFASLGLMRACGVEYAKVTGKGNPFRADSDAVVICSFGVDNLVSRMLSCVGGALNEGMRPPDALLLNRFYRLEGAKFSTSRNHAIWASAVAKAGRALSDLVRFHLLSTAPEDGETDFLAKDFRTTAAELVDRWNGIIQRMASRAVPSPAPDSTVDGLVEALKKQDTHLDPHAFRSRSLPDVVREWVHRGEAGDDPPYWWLKAFALLAWPLLPKLGSALWRFLGHNGEPDEQDFRVVTEMSGQPVTIFQFMPADIETMLRTPGSPPA